MEGKKNNFCYPLVLDASTSIIQSGIADQNSWKNVATIESTALDGVFKTLAKLLNDLKIDVRQVDAIFFCAGPGSTLGLRLALTFVKTFSWEMHGKVPLFSYNALDLASRMIQKPPTHIQAPFRMGWRVLRTGSKDQPIGQKEIIDNEYAIKKFPQSMHLKDSRNQSSKIDSKYLIDYQLAKTSGLQDLLMISESKKEIEIYNPKPPEFKKWEPRLKFPSPD